MSSLFFRHCVPGYGVLCLALAVLPAAGQTHCGGSSQSVKVENSMNTAGEPKPGASSSKTLELQLFSDRTELRESQCANLRLVVVNTTGRTARWRKEWILEQVGPTPPFPESFPRSDLELPDGSSTPIFSVRLCQADLASGEYQYRVSGAAEAGEPPRSNPVVIRVIR